MRILPRAAGLTLALLAVAVLSGCVAPKHSVIPDPLPSATPIFATDEDALAAAKEAYAAYLAVSDAIAADGGTGVSRSQPLVTAKMQAQIADEALAYTDSKLHIRGSSSFDSIALQQYEDAGAGSAIVTVYLCLDVSEVTVLDASNADVTPSSRDSRLPLEVAFDVTAGNPPRYILERSDIWNGTDFCG